MRVHKSRLTLWVLRLREINGIMNRVDGRAERESWDGRETLSLDVLVVYEDLETGLRASETLDRIARRLKATVDMHVDFWRYDLFREPVIFQQLARQEAGIVFFSTHGRTQLPATVNSWFRERFGCQGDGPRALAVLLDEKAKDAPGAAEMLEELSAAAQLAGVDVFPQVTEAAGAETQRQSALEDIRRRAETKARLPDEVLHEAERPFFREWGINE